MGFVVATDIAADREVSNAVKLALSVLDRVVEEKTYRSHLGRWRTAVVARQSEV
jgi:hypothetical protein